MEETNKHTEAPAVAFTKFRSPGGFVWSVTIRANSLGEIMNQRKRVEEDLLADQCTPEEDRRGPGRPPKFEAPSTPIETPEQREMRQATDEALADVKTACMTCGEPAQYKSGVSAKTGKPWKALFCSSGERSHVKWI